MISCYFLPFAILTLLGIGLSHAERLSSPASRKCPVSRCRVKALRSMLARDSIEVARSSSDFVMALAAVTFSPITCAIGCSGLAILIHLASDFIMEALELAIPVATGKTLSNRQSALPWKLFFALLAYMQAHVKRVLFAVLSGIVAGQLLLQFFWWLAYREELRIRKRRKRVNNTRKACGRRSCYTTHSPRKLTWTPPNILHRNFWVCTTIFTVVGLILVPWMPELVSFQAQPPASTLSSPTGINLPPAPEFDPPQWFDPPHRDQIFWLKSVATVARHSARVSWQVLTVSLPITDVPDSLPAEPLLNDSWASAEQVDPFNEAASLQLNMTTCINPDAEAWPSKGRRLPASAPAMIFPDHNGWYSSWANTMATMTDITATQMEPAYLILSFSHTPHSPSHTHASLVSIKAAAASDGRMSDGACTTDLSTAVAIKSASALQSSTPMLIRPPIAPLQSSTPVLVHSSLALLHSSTAGVLRSQLAPLHSSTALALRTPVRYPAGQGSCPAVNMPTAVTSIDYMMAVEADDPVAGLSTAVTVLAADALSTNRLASSSFVQSDSAAGNSSRKISLRPQISLTDSHPRVAAPEVDPFTLQVNMDVISNATQPHPVPAASHKDAASRHWDIMPIGLGICESNSAGGQTKIDCKHAHMSSLFSQLTYVPQKLSYPHVLARCLKLQSML